MFSNQNLGFVAPVQSQQMVYIPTINEMQTATDYMKSFTGYADAVKKYQELYTESFESSRAHQKWYALSQKQIQNLSGFIQCRDRIQFGQIPLDLQHIVNDIGEITGWDFEAVLILILGYINAAMRGRYHVQIRKNWIEAIVVYILMITQRGQLKSRLHQMLCVAFEEFQEKLISRYKGDKEKELRVSKTLSKAKSMADTFLLKSALKEACDENGDVDIANFLAQAHSFAEEMAEYSDLGSSHLSDPSFLMDGSTYKKCMRIMSEAGGGVAILQPEATTLIEMIKDPRFDPKIFLKSHGMEYFSDATLPGGCIEVKNPFLNIVVFTQHGRARELYTNQKLVDSGLADRFIPFFPPRAKEPSATPEKFNDEVLKNYEQKIMAMLERNYTQEKDRQIFTISVEPNARQEIENYRTEMKNVCDKYVHVDQFEFLSKLAGTASRIAGILHAWQYDKPHETLLSQQTMQAGIQITRVISDHAWHALSPSGFRAVADAKKILEWVRRHQYSFFTSREIAQGSGVKINEKIFPALDLLEQHNILTQHITPKKPRMCMMHPNFDYNS